MSRAQFLIRFGYAGDLFHGLQPQKDVSTAGGTLNDLIARAAGQAPKALCFAARTDKGVHALANIATFWFKEPFNRFEFLDNIHRVSALGLHSIRCIEVDRKVHARGSSHGKYYRYLLNGSDPAKSWQIVPDLDLRTMQVALEQVLGEHDFSSFRASGCTAGSPIKTLYRASIRETSEGIAIDFYGDAFLRQMIRILVGILVEIGTGLRKPYEIKWILEARNRKAAGITAPACGLTLVSVELNELGALIK